VVTTDRSLRRDAQRNRDLLVAAARRLFAERGLDAPLEEVAKAAGVSIGTLYNRFPTRGKLVDAALAGRVAEMVRVAEEAAAVDDPWQGLTTLLEGAGEMQAGDRGYNELCCRVFDDADEINALRDRGAARIRELVDRAKAAGALRPDFEFTDLAWVTWSLARTIEAAPGELWRRQLAFLLDGLRAPGRLEV
jgi:AcrR family transcriptional regulator